MTPEMDTSSEAWRRVCEARHWLRQGCTSRAAVDELMARLAKHGRGAVAITALRDEMRRQWSCRREWLDPLRMG